MNLPVIQPAPNGCLGHCCYGFTVLEEPPEVLRAAYESRMRGEEYWIDPRTDEKRPWLRDIETVYPMLIPLGVKKFNPMNGLQWEEDDQRAHMVYTCKNLDRETSSCMIYANRPDMCSRFGHDHPCAYHGCTFEGEPVEETP